PTAYCELETRLRPSKDNARQRARIRATAWPRTLWQFARGRMHCLRLAQHFARFQLAADSWPSTSELSRQDTFIVSGTGLQVITRNGIRDHEVSRYRDLSEHGFQNKPSARLSETHINIVTEA